MRITFVFVLIQLANMDSTRKAPPYETPGTSYFKRYSQIPPPPEELGFDPFVPSNVTVQQGDTAYLKCKIYGVANL